MLRSLFSLKGVFASPLIDCLVHQIYEECGVDPAWETTLQSKNKGTILDGSELNCGREGRS
jgi:hypothetical protein